MSDSARPSPQIDRRYAPLVQFIEQGIPFNAHLGLTVELLDDGRAVLRVPWAQHLVGDVFRPSVHGGVTSMLIDTAGGCCCFTRLMDPADRASTVDLRVDYLRPGRQELLRGQGRVMRMGNRVGVADMHVSSVAEPDRVIASGKGVYNISRRPD